MAELIETDVRLSDAIHAADPEQTVELVGQLLTGQILASTHDDFSVIFQIAAAVNGAGALVFLAFGAGRDQRYDEPRGGGGGLGAAAVAPLGAKLLADDDGAAAASGS